MDDSTLSKMQLHYWQAKQTFLKKVKRKEDDCIVSSDAELDAKLELLKSIDETNQNLLTLLDLYQDRVCALAQEECIIGRFMRECGKVDPSKAGKLMSGSGKTLLFASHQFILLRSILVRAYHDVQTFQYRAVADTFDTVEQMEKSRTAYRAALLWMKDISKQLDPEAYGQMDKFKKVQNHVRKTKKTFEKLKMDSIQKIDLLSASRCNLFSSVFTNYQNNLQTIWDKSSKVMNIFVDTFSNGATQSYEFQVLKELNDDSCEDRFESFEAGLKAILAQNNINEKDMLVFFEADYSDERRTPGSDDKSRSKSPRTKKTKSSKSTKNAEEPKTEEGEEALNTSNLLDLNFGIDRDSKSDSNSKALDDFMPSTLIDLDHMNTMDNAELIKSDFEQLMNWKPSSAPKEPSPTKNTKTKNPNESTLESWLNMFADIDPLANPSDFDKFSSDKNHFDRNC
ncbi:hypothetical protein RDWZM_007072 [Blomia tropicalis]|uniref:AH domain-containing protein n=1 Tax=Blomia tropicalis TaxID=40697 RepID=A0A9Q0RP66_BLOTA|nr:hypothetical protein RDWZM_007072 [Blomia tropicalis]